MYSSLVTPASKKRTRAQVSPQTDTANKMAKTFKLPKEAPAWARTLYDGITAKIDEIHDNLTTQINAIAEDKIVLENKVKILEDRNKTLEQRINQLEIDNGTLQDKFLYQESYDRRLNLVFHGFSETTWEIQTQTEEVIQTFIKDKLKINDIKIEYVRRVGSRTNLSKPRPIVVRFSTLEDRQKVWKSRKIDLDEIKIFQDFPKEINDRRRVLIPILNKAKTLDTYKTNSYIYSDKLVINSKTYTVNTLSSLPDDLDPRKIATQTTGDYTFFWGKQSPLSNHFKCKFMVDGIVYNCNEQYFKYHQAMYANNKEIADAILSAEDPVTQLKLAKGLVIQDKEEWQKTAIQIMRQGLAAKFKQNPPLSDFLINTKDSELVEASPYDTFWGVGISMKSPEILTKSNWKGENHLGTLLMEVRDTLSV